MSIFSILNDTLKHPYDQYGCPSTKPCMARKIDQKENLNFYVFHTSLGLIWRYKCCKHSKDNKIKSSLTTNIQVPLAINNSHSKAIGH